MNRRADFSLLYEIIGLIIFATTALIWFGGIESIIGGLLQDRPIVTFNKITQAIREQCTGGVNETLIMGLDLKSSEATYIITQLSIPESFRTDAETMGFIQPNMRKCVGADCICLLELKELDGNWQMCTTSDYDSWNLEYGALAGPPGCPFWYYAPPDIIEQSSQAVIDMLSMSGFDVLLAAFKLSKSTEEHFAYSSPEMWGGCSGAVSDNLSISGYYKDTSNFDCSKLQDKKLAEQPFSVQSSSLNFDKGFIKNQEAIDYYSDLTAEVITTINNSVESVLTTYFTTPLNSRLTTSFENTIGNHVSNNLSTSGSQLRNELSASYRTLIGRILTDNSKTVINSQVTACINELLTQLNQTFNGVYYTHDKISGTNTGSETLSINSLANMTIEVGNVSPYTKSFYVSALVRNDTADASISVSIGSCLNYTNVNTNGFSIINLLFPVTCINSGIINISLRESNNDINHAIRLAKGGYISPGVKSYLNNQLLSANWTINITFNEFLKNTEIKDNVINELAVLSLNDALDSINTDVDTYKKLISDKLGELNFDVVNTNAYNNLTLYYNNYFSTLINRKVYETQDCYQVFDATEILSTYDNATNLLRNNLTKSYSSVVQGISGIDLSGFNTNMLDILNQAKTNYPNVSPYAIDAFAFSLASEQYPIINNTLSTCLGIQDTENYRTQLVSEYTNALANTLKNSSTTLKTNLFSNVPNAVQFPIGFSFSNEFASIINNGGTTVSANFLEHYLSNINLGLVTVSNIVRNKVDSAYESAWGPGKWSKTGCWPMVGITNSNDCPSSLGIWNPSTGKCYFTGYSQVNDLLGYRRYTSVSRLTPLLMAFEIKALQGLVNMAAATWMYKNINDGVSVSYGSPTAAGQQEFAETIVKPFSSRPPMSSSGLFDILSKVNAKAIMPATKYDFPKTNTTGMTDYSTITGKSIGTALASFAGTILGTSIKQGFKQFIRDNWKKVLFVAVLTVGANIGLNCWKNTLISKLQAEEVIYSDGGLRTFNPDKVLVRACMRMDELGCYKNDAVWVNETFYCQTDLYVRRLVTPDAWFKYLRGQDRCRSHIQEDKQCLGAGIAIKNVGCTKSEITCEIKGTNVDCIEPKAVSGGLFGAKETTPASCTYSNNEVTCVQNGIESTDIYNVYLSRGYTCINSGSKFDCSLTCNYDGANTFICPEDTCTVTTQPNICYKDTLTSCYQLSCDTTGATNVYNKDRYHVFQYWIGAGGDPAGIMGMTAGTIQALRVYNATIPENGNKIIMQVLGGNEIEKLPPSIV